MIRTLSRHTATVPVSAVGGDLVEDGVCGLFIAQKLGIGQPKASEHLRILVHAGLLRPKRIKQWTFYKRDENASLR
jgi:ArsR family transcriptional regulator